MKAGLPCYDPLTRSQLENPMAKELIRPERFIELANSEIETHQRFQPGMRLSLGASLEVMRSNTTERARSESRSTSV
jgi:hypothetical protein